MSNDVEILRVLSIRSKDPGVLATVDGHFVKWSTRRGWNCACLTDVDEYQCEHIAVIRDMLDDRVTTPLRVRAAEIGGGS